MSRFLDLAPFDGDFEAYLKADAVGSTSICRALGKTGPTEKTGDLGSATHCAVLEPDHLERRYVVAPEDCQVGSGRGQRARLEEWRQSERGDRVELSPSDWETACAMRDALEGRELLAWLRKGGVEFEQSYMAVDSETGLVVRAKPDAWRPKAKRPQAWDLKTAKDPSFDAFSRSIASNFYMIQAALYLDVLGLDRFYWLCVGKAWPHHVALYQATDDWIEIGRRLYTAGLRLIARARDTGEPLRTWWSDRPQQLEPPPKWLDEEVMLHEQYADRVCAGRRVA